MNWRDSLKRLVTAGHDDIINEEAWARTFGASVDEVTLALAEYRGERDAIELLKARPEAGGD